LCIYNSGKVGLDDVGHSTVGLSWLEVSNDKPREDENEGPLELRLDCHLHIVAVSAASRDTWA